MKRLSNTWLLSIIITILTASGLFVCYDVYQRILSESNNQIKELSLDYDQIVELSNDSLQDTATILASTKQSNAISSIILKERTIDDFIRNGQATLLSGYEIENSLRIGQNYRSLISHLKKRGGVNKQNIYLVIDQYKNYNLIKDTLILNFSSELIKERGFNILELSTSKQHISSIGVGFDTKIIQKLQSHGFNVIPKFVPNPNASKQLVQFKFQQLEKIDGIYTISFDTPYLGANEHRDVIIQQLLDNNYKLLFSRSHRDSHLLQLVKVGSEIILGSSEFIVPLSSTTPYDQQSLLDQHTVFTHIKLHYLAIPATELLSEYRAFLSHLNSQLSTHHISLATEYVYSNSNYPILTPLKLILFSLSLLIILIYLVQKFFLVSTKALIGLSMVYLSVFGVICLFIDPLIWTRFQMLVTVISFSTLSLIQFYPLLDLKSDASKFKQSSLYFAKSVLLSLIGGLTIVSMTYTSPFLSGYAQFYGVSLSLLISLILSSYYFLIGPERIQSGFYIIKRSLLSPINSMTLISFLIVLLLVGSFWFRDSINILNIFEHYIDSIFNQFQFLRPRFKEFAVGFPAILLSIYGRDFLFPKQWTWFFIGLGSIGLVSILHSFCIVHTPLVITLGQLLVSMASGFLFFLIYLSTILLFKRLLSSN